MDSISEPSMDSTSGGVRTKDLSVVDDTQFVPPLSSTSRDLESQQEQDVIGSSQQPPQPQASSSKQSFARKSNSKLESTQVGKVGVLKSLL